jgi:hypothetical protein
VSRGDAIDHRGALEAVERILNRGGDAEDVLRAVLEALRSRGISFASVQLAGSDGLSAALAVGERAEAIAVPVVYEGSEVGSLELAANNRAFVETVATLISHYVVHLESGRRPMGVPPERSDGSN